LEHEPITIASSRAPAESLPPCYAQAHPSLKGYPYLSLAAGMNFNTFDVDKEIDNQGDIGLFLGWVRGEKKYLDF